MSPELVGVDWIALRAFVWERNSVDLFQERAHVDYGRGMLSREVTLLEGEKQARQLKLPRDGSGIRDQSGVVPVWGSL